MLLVGPWYSVLTSLASKTWKMVCGRVHWMRGGVVMVSMSRVPRQLENASGKLLRRRPMALTQ